MKVVILTGNRYPHGDAGALRQHSVAKALYSVGHDVVVLGYGDSTNGRVGVFDDIPYVSFRPKTNNILIRALYRYFFVDRALAYLFKKNSNVDAIIAIDFFPKDFKKIVKASKRYNAILIHDSVEWYSPEEFSDGEKNRDYLNKEYTNTVAIDNNWRVIAISTYLEHHFAQRCQMTVRIPVILDVAKIDYRIDINENEEKIKIAYVGSPGKKDYLKNILEGVELVSNEMLKNVEFNVVGVSDEQLKSVCGAKKETLEKLEGVLHAHGRLPHDKAVEFVRNSDFTVLLRDESLRYAKAGFPTKIVESLSCGTPPICNLSSDLGMYLNDGENAIISNGHSPIEAKSAIERALSLTADERKKMRIEARKTAEQHFDYRNYISKIENLLK